MNTNTQSQFNTLSGVSLILFPVVAVAASLLALAGSSAAAYLRLLGAALMIPAMVSMGIWSYRRAPQLALIGGLIGIVGTAAGGVGWGFLDLFAVASGDPALVETVSAATGAIAWLSLFGLLSPLGFILLALAAKRAGQPSWVTAVQIVSMVLFIAAWFTPAAVALLANVTALLGFGWLGWQFLSRDAAVSLAATTD